MRDETKPGSNKGTSSASSGMHEKIAKESFEQENKESKFEYENLTTATSRSEMLHWVSSETVKMEEARKRGYTDQFMLEGKKLKSLTSNEYFTPDQVKIVDHFRFEGISDPDYMSILYLIETRNGRKGTVTDAFGTYGDPDLEDFMKQVRDCTIHNL